LADKKRNRRHLSQEGIYGLWDELADFPVARANDAIHHLFARMCQWMHAENAFWIGAVRVERGAPAKRDLMSGWRAAAIYMLDPSRIDKRRQNAGLRALNKEQDPGETSRALAAQAGRFRLATLRSGDLVDLAAFRKTTHYDWHYRALDISDRLWAVFPVNDDTEAYYCFDKHRKNSRFTDRDREIAANVLRGLKWFHRQLLLSHGLGAGEKSLTANQRRLVHLLLTDKTEKQIADHLKLTQGSVHQYAVSIYRKFGVRGRAGLMAMWLSRGA